MNNIGKIVAGIAGVAVIGAALYFGGVFDQGGDQGGNGGGDSGIDVSGTPCEGIGAARAAVDAEYEDRKTKADDKYREDMEQASDDYWETRRDLNDIKYACESKALLADPCKDLFERASVLAQEILADIDSGFDEAKFQEREEVKKEYDECVKNPPEEETYEGKKARCEDEFRLSELLAQDTRTQAEANAFNTYTDAFDKAANDYKSKHAQLDAIEKECNKPPTTTGVTVGRVGTGSTGTVVQSGSPACTGNFQGYDPEIQSEISRLRSLYNQARTAGKVKGLGGTEALGAKITELRADMAEGPSKCQADSDCGDTEPVCCSDSEVGVVMCVDGECANEKTECEEDEVCAGKPAECVGGGTVSEPISISRTITIGQTCSNRLRSLDLQPSDENSDRFEITGNIPDWLSFTSVGGQLPTTSEVQISCSGLMAKGPGTYTANGAITVYDTENNLINTIPIIVNIEVKAAPVVEDEDKIKVGEDVDLIEDEDDSDGTVSGGDDLIIEDEKAVTVGPSVVEFTYNHASPTCPLSIPSIYIEAPIDSTYTITGDEPVWFNLSPRIGMTYDITSDGKTLIKSSFPCQLDKYEDQEQSTNLNIQVETPSGKKSSHDIQVIGSFINF